ncbi:enoyl-CoA hydratase/isomerase family protein [Muricoccus radiodurans]|uniref:enoyl-CoA hydratase/isomerase family protein n=1 Tax=Muricoccus radiodurans TaxID=2231721 RepID=UPI003CEBCDB7
MSYEALGLAVEAGVATLTLRRPQVLNALNRRQRLDLIDAFLRLDADDAVRCIVLRGEGRAFCAGQDQKESAGMDAAAAHDRIEHYLQLYDRMRRCSKPVIARMHGPVAGAGLQLALLCDLRIAAEDTRCGMTEFNIGSAAITASFLLVPVIGESLTRRLIMMADFIPASEALSWHLLHEVHPEGALDARVAEVAAGLAAKPPGGIRLTKEWWRLRTEDEFGKLKAFAHEAHAANFAAGALSAGARAFVAGKRA